MNIQTIIAISVVVLAACVVMRSWIAFWIGLIRPSESSKPVNAKCHGCAHGCQNTANSPTYVELKREPLD